MHAGRVSHEAVNGGYEVVGPSAIPIEGDIHTPRGKMAYPVPRALGARELPAIVQEFVQASVSAISAGFDGIELHSANGYLLHEFLSPASNQRDDIYGGSPENRARFVIEVTEAVAAVVGADRVGIRISPEHNIQGALETEESDVLSTYGALLDAISPLNLAYLSILHADPAGELVQGLRNRFAGPFLVNTGFGVVTTREKAMGLVTDGHADAVVVGRPTIANPDLVRRWSEGLPLNEANPATFYGEGAEGYTDYPAYQN
jgi:2,4-dienoyl-CoA reductase-like NADH-dependent reductase (Old Yellow Enzyme family)